MSDRDPIEALNEWVRRYRGQILDQLAETDRKRRLVQALCPGWDWAIVLQNDGYQRIHVLAPPTSDMDL